MRYKSYKLADIVEINDIKYIIIYYSSLWNTFYGLVDMKTGGVIYTSEDLSGLSTIIHNLKLGRLK